MIVVGVAGHRVLADVERIRKGIDRAIRRIDQMHPGRALAVMSALAEGSDRLVADAILARADSSLTAVIPIPTEDYVTDFASAESIAEFERLLSRAGEVVVMQSRPTRDESYETAARYIVDHCDVLIAIWDGKNAQGRGGTAATIARARQLELPIAWIKAGNRLPGTMDPTTLGAEQGSVVFENVWCA